MSDLESWPNFPCNTTFRLLRSFLPKYSRMVVKPLSVLGGIEKPSDLIAFSNKRIFKVAATSGGKYDFAIAM